jgi:hypothetical protein
LGFSVESKECFLLQWLALYALFYHSGLTSCLPCRPLVALSPCLISFINSFTHSEYS